MKWKDHSELKDKHAFLSPSKYHWLNYDEQKLIDSYINHMYIQRGVELHEFAEKAIRLKIKMGKEKTTLSMYINDAIKYNMTPEQTLVYSDNCFGTADAICFDGKVLRIHDLKTGKIKANMKQLLIYCALFCLEYNVDPLSIKYICQIYQNQLVQRYDPKGEEILSIIIKIKDSNEIIDNMGMEDV